ncbi:MoaD family protein [Hahella ganghwensis]|uniref:MoaD family protein n=1 Tax=Hahella ganghwensis TaxID=286420 RepID=UPI000372F664|nr:MoaD family protein [Hahella ganghwensis]
MPVKVKIPTILRTLTDEQKEVVSEGATIREVIESLESQYPGIRERLLKNDEVHKFMNIYVNEDDIRFKDQLATTVQQSDTITILPAVAGG